MISSKLGIYSIKDKHIGMHLPPFLASSDDEAKRIVADSIEPNSVLARFPADYQLIREGVFDSKCGLSRDPEDMITDVLCSITDIIRDQIINETSVKLFPSGSPGSSADRMQVQCGKEVDDE